VVFRGSAALALLLTACAPRQVAKPTATRTYADVIFHADIVTLDPSKRKQRPKAVAVRGGRIVHVGTVAGAKKWADDATRVVNWQGLTFLPGFADAHGHLVGLGRSLGALDLRGSTSFDEVLERTQAYAKEHPGDGWLLGRGWDQNEWKKAKLPDGEALTTAFPGRPVLLTRVDGHAVVANRAALDAAGITAESEDPPGGRILRRKKTGEPTGVLVDRAIDLVAGAVPPPSADAIQGMVRAAADHLLSKGITQIHDAGTSVEALTAIEALAQAGDLKVRVYAMVDGSSEEGWKLLRWAPRVGLYDHRLTVRSVKLMADGALGSRGALLTEDYSDDAGNRGLAVTTPHELMAKAREATERGYQVSIHAIGDAGNRMVLDIFETIMARALRKGDSPRARIEHAQVVDPSDHSRMSAMKVVASMQPVHCTSDMGWAGARLGPKRVKWAYAWRSLSDAGVTLAFGSDTPVEGPDPIVGIHAAVTRTDEQRAPEGGWQVQERIRIEEALAAYTTGAAHAAFEEELRGTIAVGKLADFTVLDRNLLELGPDDVLGTRVMATVVGGEIAWERREGD
jgi:predicted amidohydrolase YtcJ